MDELLETKKRLTKEIETMEWIWSDTSMDDLNYADYKALKSKLNHINGLLSNPDRI